MKCILCFFLFDVILIIILNWRYNYLFFCRDREVVGLDIVVFFEIIVVYDIKVVISGVCICIILEM